MRSLVLVRSSFVFCAALAACGLVACGSSKPAEAPAAPPPPPPEPAKAEPEAPPAPPAPVVVKDVGFATPESVLYDAAGDIYLVSNINGDPFGKDDNGFISKLSPDGKVAELKWIDGSASKEVELNAPKGLGISDGKLYVADIDSVRIFDLATGKPAGNVKIAGSTFLNDIAVAPDGTVYVSDTGLKTGFAPNQKDAIYKIGKDNKSKALIKSADLKNPNGLSADDKGLTVVTWTGEVYRVSNDGKKEEATKAPGGQLDGVVQTSDGLLLVSSWETSTVYSGKADGTLAPLAADLKSPADIGYDSKRSQVLIPLFQDNAVVIHALPAAVASADKPAEAPKDATASSEKAEEKK
jgi:hypothetical protein